MRAHAVEFNTSMASGSIASLVGARASLGSAEAFAALFPAGYHFYYFAAGSNDSGHYRLAPYEYGMTPHIEDVIACPGEKLSALPL